MADLDTLNLRIQSESQSAASTIDRTVASLSRLQRTLGSIDGATLRGMDRMGDAFTNLQNAVSRVTSDQGSLKGLKTLAQSLKILRNSVQALGRLNATDFQNLQRSLKNIADASHAIGSSELAKIRELGSAVQSIKNAEKVDLSKIASGMNKIASSGRSSSSHFDRIGSSLKRVSSVVKTVTSGFRKFASLAKSAGNTAVKAFRSVRNAIDLSGTAFGKFLQKFASRAISMAMRAMIKAITSAFSEGLESLYKYADDVKRNLDDLATASTGLKAAAGSALYSALSAISGVLSQIIGYATTALNAISQLFSALTGASTYYKGISTDAKMYDENTKKATESTKELKNALTGVDEINTLGSASSSSSSTPTAETPDEMVNSFVKENIGKDLLDAVKTADFTKIGKTIGDKINTALGKIPWNKMRKSLMDASKSLVTLINSLFKSVKPGLMGQSLANLFNVAMESINNFWMNTDWENIGTWFSNMLGSAFDDINGEQIGMFLVRKIRAILQFATGLFKGDMSFDKIGETLKGMIRGALTAMADLDIPGLARSIFEGIGNGIRMVADLIRSEEFRKLWFTILDNIVEIFNNLPDLGDVFKNLGSSLWELLKDTIDRYFGKEENNDGFQNILDSLVRGIKGSIQKAKAWIKSDDSTQFIEDLGDGIGKVLTTAFERIKVGAEIFADIAGDLWELLKTAIIKLFGGDTNDTSFDNVGDSIATGIKNAITGAVEWLRSDDGKKRIKEIGTRISMLFENLKIAASTFIKFAGKIFGAVLEALNEEFSLEEKMQSIKDTVVDGVMKAVESLGSTDEEGNIGLPKLILNVGEIIVAGLGAIKLFGAIKSALSVGLTALGATVGSKLTGALGGSNLGFTITGLIAAFEFAKATIDIAEDIQTGADITQDQISKLLASALTVASSIAFIVGQPVPGAVCLSLAAIFELDSILWKVKRDPRNTAEIVRNAMKESGGEDAVIDVAVGLNTKVSGFAKVKGDIQEIVDKFNELTGLNFDHSQMVQFLKDCHVLADGTEDSVRDLAFAIQDVFAVNAWSKLGDVAVTNNLKEIGKMANLTDEQVETLISTMLGLQDLNLTGEVDVNTEEFDFHMKGTMAWLETYARKISDTDGKEIDNTVKINGVQTAINYLQSVYNSVPDTKTISVGVQYKAGGFGSYAYNSKKLLGYASGGFVSKGEVFIAGESGSELIGQINGRSAVANKAEIGDAIFRYMDAHDSRSNNGLSAESIAGAVVGAIKSTGLGAVYLDGKQLAASIRSESKRIGHSAV